MKIFVAGANGQIGWELVRSLMPLGEIVAAGRENCDLSKPHSLKSILGHINPDVIVNAAAYTAVDRAEEEETLATTINATAVKEFAVWAKKHAALLVHFSTDYVFDGSKSVPCTEADGPNPINAYGRSKLAGELALAEVNPDFLCLRTTWVYANRGKNFFLTMLKLGKENESLRVVSDQIGAPTWARNIADATAILVAKAQLRRADRMFISGVYHLTARGRTSWHGFSELIFATAKQNGVELRVTSVIPVSTREYPLPAKRPAYSVLDCTKLEAEWGIVLPAYDEVLKYLF